MRITTPNVAGRSFGVRVDRGGRLIVSVRGGGRVGRSSRRGEECLHHRFSCSGFRRTLVLPRSIIGRGVDTGTDGNILAVSLPGHAPRRGTGIGEIVRVRWSRVLGVCGRAICGMRLWRTVVLRSVGIYLVCYPVIVGSACLRRRFLQVSAVLFDISSRLSPGGDPPLLRLGFGFEAGLGGTDLGFPSGGTRRRWGEGWSR